ncbi:Na/Pi cotransporter family protein [Lachnoclostridium sp. Marseille-P6806]|uniref:Na/Pi cotransporter family protein n=1 Tax=Lachnoclostridium sp. Marseille-P6806 TaxID=2364793 RepID=UPI0010313531|nr:Na/Pi cotransporter family protein [Lachnoclostridium sp. Marseille-P6806]
MTIFQFIEMLGGLALFLYGMEVMGAGLKSASSGKLERLLERLTSNKWKGALLGTGVTAVIQSSGATVVMVVGLVNSGIMTLEQSVGVTIGANVGTTITAWLLSLTGISGSNVFLSLVKPDHFAPILALAGVILIMMAKKDRTRKAAQILMGFAVLMIGMTTMSGALSPLADDPDFVGLLTMFSNRPLLGLLAGLIVTVALQSSSASIGILQAISMSGSLTVGSMFPPLMGANIGSAITGLIGAIGANRTARRAAWLQMIYCIIKAGVFMISFYAINSIVHFPFMGVITSPVMIATIHTCFNIAALLVFLPGSELLVRMVERMIPVLPGEQTALHRIAILDEHFLDTPSFALEQAGTAMGNMAKYSREAMDAAMELVFVYDEEKAARVGRIEEMVDDYEDQLNSYLVKLSRGNLSARESHTLSILLHCVNDFERMTDHALNIMQSARELHEKELAFSAKAKEEMQVYGKAVSSIVDMAVRAFIDNDLALARQVEPLESVIDGINMEEKRRHVRRLRKGKCTVEAGFILQDIAISYERVADHCSNIAVDLLQVGEDGFDTHEYLMHEREAATPEFSALVRQFEETYALPGLKKDEDGTADAVDKYVKREKTAAGAKSGKAAKKEKSAKAVKKALRV